MPLGMSGAQSLSAGIGLGLNARQVHNQNQARQQQLEMKKQEDLRNRIAETFKTALATASQAADYASKIVADPKATPQQKEDAIRALGQTKLELFRSTEQTGRAAIQSGLISPDEHKLALEQLNVASQVKPLQSEANFNAQSEGMKTGAQEAAKQPFAMERLNAQTASQERIANLQAQNAMKLAEKKAELAPKTAVKQPIPETAQQDFTNSFAALDMLDTMEKTNHVTGWNGALSWLESKAGFNKDAIDFEVAKNQFKLMAQSLIKGTPSNFDVETVIATLPSLFSTEAKNTARINQSRKLFKQLISDKIGYYKGTNKQIPPNIVNRAAELGIDVQNVPEYTDETFPRDRGNNMAVGIATDQELADMWRDPNISDRAKIKIKDEIEKRIGQRE